MSTIFCKKLSQYQKMNKYGRTEWGGDVFFSHGSNHSKGVSILVNPSVIVSVENCYKLEILTDALLQLTYSTMV